MTDRSSDPCDGCALVDRRDFLRDAAGIATTLLIALGAKPARAVALPVRYARGRRVSKDEHSWPIPAADGAIIDKDNSVIVVRCEQKAYVFNLSCPHQNTALRWHPDDNQFQCPKHHSRYRPDGVFISGRATRGMDRFVVRKDGANIVADLDKLLKEDEDAADWPTAFVPIDGPPVKG
ncbi:MAG TPA: Rieske 2Fe-2S domain-containing protein [Gemmatimonadales bacterium]|jgi:Rieske Fe-S protein